MLTQEYAFHYQEDGAAFCAHLDPRSRRRFARWAERGRRNQHLTELALRCAIHGDTRGYLSALDALHPGVGAAGQLSLSCFLSKMAWQIRLIRDTALPVSASLRPLANRDHQSRMGPSIADRFTIAETELLGRRFAWLDARLRAPAPQFMPGFQSGPVEYWFEETAEPVSMGGFLESWR